MSSLPLQLPPTRLFLQILLMRLTAIAVAFAMIGSLGVASLARAQYPVPPGMADGPPLFAQQELDQMLAPVALYPDELLAQVLMAATYPEEVGDAARWAAQSPGAAPDQLQASAASAPWDPSVKALLSFPQVLNMMAQNAAWTERLGDAFLGQRDQVMQTVQGLRQRARAAGTLVNTPQQNVVMDGSYISIVPPQPNYVYVPTYDPNVVYGSWWWPSAPPTYFAPAPGVTLNRGYYWGAAIVAGAALWGYFNWRQHNVAINVTRYNRYHPTHIQSPVWNHNPVHRGAVPYRQPDVRQRFQQRAEQAHRQAPQRALPPPPRVQAQPDRRGPPDRGPDNDRRGPQPGADHRGPPGQPPGKGPDDRRNDNDRNDRNDRRPDNDRNDRRGPPGAQQQRAPAALVSPPVTPAAPAAQAPAQHPAQRGPQMDRGGNADHRPESRGQPHAPAAAPPPPRVVVPQAAPAPAPAAAPAPRVVQPQAERRAAPQAEHRAPPQAEHRAPPQAEHRAPPAAPRPQPQPHAAPPAPRVAPPAAPHPQPQAEHRGGPPHGGPPPGKGDHK